MQATMQDAPLTLTALFRHGATVYPDSLVVTATAEGSRSATYAEVANRAARLAAALHRLGVGATTGSRRSSGTTRSTSRPTSPSPRWARCCTPSTSGSSPSRSSTSPTTPRTGWSSSTAPWSPVLARMLPELKTVEHVLVVGDGRPRAARPRAGVTVHGYEDLLAARVRRVRLAGRPGRAVGGGDVLHERDDGQPEGRRLQPPLHLPALDGRVHRERRSRSARRDRVLPIVPMFHANAWGLPYAAWMSGADLLMPDRFLQAEPLCRFMTAERPTMSGAVPTVWNDVLAVRAIAENVDLSFFRLVACGGSAVPRALMQAFQERLRRRRSCRPGG